MDRSENRRQDAGATLLDRVNPYTACFKAHGLRDIQVAQVLYYQWMAKWRAACLFLGRGK
jgi:hypothetical protein